MLYPNEIYNKIEEINIEELIKKGIKGIILDVDNTLIDKSKILSEEKEKWVNEAKQKGLKVCILSNTLKKEKVETLSKKLGIPYYMFAKKPLTGGFKKCIKLFSIAPNEICVIGDQIFTDVLGGNICKMYTIYVHPISEEDYSITTKIKRPFEKIVIKKYLSRKEK